MIHSSLRRSTASLLCVLSLCASAPAAFAQDENTQQEALELYVGDIFEILPLHTLENPTYTWILTQDRTFIEAGRAQTFRKRLITPGRYTLYAEISSADQSRHLSRSFTLDYKPRTPGMPLTPAAGSGSSDSSLVRTVPAQDVNMRVIVPEQSQLVKLEPLNPDVRPVVADLDTSRDTDGDGNPSNDIDTDLTFFQTDATPLYVWMAEPFTTRTIAVTAAMPDGAMVQNIEVAGEVYAREKGLIQSPVAVQIKQTSGRLFNFTAAFEIPAAPNTPLLYHWEFGDGQQSLLANPTHEYTEDGTYDVKLRIRNLTNGKDVAAFTQQVDVKEMTDGGTTPEPEQPVDTPEPEDNTSGMGMSIGSILLMVGIFIGSILFGLLVIFVLSKLRRKGTSMSDTIEAMEQSIIKKDDATPTLSIAPAPSTVKATTPPPDIAKREEEREMETPTVSKSPRVDEANAPTWLKSGLNAATSPAAPKTQAAPAAPVTPPAPKPPVQQQKAPTTPPWLQKPAAPVAPPPAPKPAAPAPATAPAATPQAKPVTPPAPAAQQTQTKPAAVPPWLQTPSAPAAAPKPVTPPVPAAPTPQPVAAPVQTPQAVVAPAAPVTPKPAPAPQAPVTPPKPVPPAPVQQPAMPKPVAPQPAAAPVQAPKPVPPTPVAPVTPAPVPASAVPKPVIPPVQTAQPQTPVVPKPAPAPVAPPAAPVTPKPVPPAPVAPVTPPAPPVPAPTPAPTPSIDQNDQPIAIIRADSLGNTQPVQPRPEAQNPPAAV